MATPPDSSAERDQEEGPEQPRWLNKPEFIRFLTNLAANYPPSSRTRDFLEEYIEDLRRDA